MDKLLRQFLEIAEQGSISAAASRLHVSQPAISFNMKKLEESLQVSLFVRTARGMKLSDYGEILADHARIMARLDHNARSSIEALRMGRDMGLRIGCGHAWWSLFLRDLAFSQSQKHPDAPISIDVGSQLSCMDHLLSGFTTLFIGHEITSLSDSIGAVFEPLFAVGDGLFVRKGHPLAGRICDSADIDPYGIVDSVPMEEKHRQIVDGSYQPHVNPLSSRPIRQAFEANSLLACIDFAAHSDAIMTYPAVMADYFYGFGLVQLKTVRQPDEKTVGIYTLEERRQDKQVIRSCDLVRHAVGDWLSNYPDATEGIAPTLILHPN